MYAEEKKTVKKKLKSGLWSLESGVWLVAVILLLFLGLGHRSLWGSEGRWAEITREMLVSGDFFHPTIGGDPYFDKPLVTYWIIAAFSALVGRLDE